MSRNKETEGGVIACLGWGSLIWDPRTMPVRGAWLVDGPPVRAEFLRKSRDGRITLVLHESVPPVPCLWTAMDMNDPEEARMALAEREGIRPRRLRDLIGVWYAGSEPPHGTISGLPEWAAGRNVKALVWTKLAHNFHGSDSERIANGEEIIAYLASLEGQARARAERYIRRAPRQVDTQIRRAIVAALGWRSDERG